MITTTVDKVSAEFARRSAQKALWELRTKELQDIPHVNKDAIDAAILSERRSQKTYNLARDFGHCAIDLAIASNDNRSLWELELIHVKAKDIVRIAKQFAESAPAVAAPKSLLSIFNTAEKLVSVITLAQQALHELSPHKQYLVDNVAEEVVHRLVMYDRNIRDATRHFARCATELIHVILAVDLALWDLQSIEYKKDEDWGEGWGICDISSAITPRAVATQQALSSVVSNVIEFASFITLIRT